MFVNWLERKFSIKLCNQRLCQEINIIFDYEHENSETKTELSITDISFYEFQNMTDNHIKPILTSVLAFEVPD